MDDHDDNFAIVFAAMGVSVLFVFLAHVRVTMGFKSTASCPLEKIFAASVMPKL